MDFLWVVPEKSIRKILFVFYTVGVAGFLIPFTRPAFVYLIPFTLFANFIIVLWFQKRWNLPLFLVLFFIAVAGFFIEWLGVRTGYIFGNYHYSNVLGPKWGNTSLIIGANWLMLVIGSQCLVSIVKLPRFIMAFAGAVLMLIYDYILEPVAVRLNMWSWDGGIIPLQNYLAWFLIALFFHYIYLKIAGKPQNTIGGYVFIAQLLFFGALRAAIAFRLL